MEAELSLPATKINFIFIFKVTTSQFRVTCWKPPKKNISIIKIYLFPNKQHSDEKIHLRRLEDLAKRAISELQARLIVADDVVKLVDQGVRLQNPFPLSHVPSNPKQNHH
jgi:hypothetical protein